MSEEKKYILIFNSNYEGELDEDTFLDTYIEINSINCLLEIGNKIGDYEYIIEDIVFKNRYYDEKINVGYKIKLNDGMGNCIGVYDSNNKYINLIPLYYVIGTKSELKFYSDFALDNKIKNLKEICLKFNNNNANNKNINKIENILLEKMSLSIKKIIFGDELDDEDLKYI